MYARHMYASKLLHARAKPSKPSSSMLELKPERHQVLWTWIVQFTIRALIFASGAKLLGVLGHYMYITVHCRSQLLYELNHIIIDPTTVLDG